MVTTKSPTASRRVAGEAIDQSAGPEQSRSGPWATGALVRNRPLVAVEGTFLIAGLRS